MYAYQSVAKQGADQRRAGGTCYRIDPSSGNRIEIDRKGNPIKRKGKSHG